MKHKTYKTILLFFFQILYFYSFSQDEYRPKKLHVGAFVSSDYSYRTLNSSSIDGAIVLDAREKYEVPKVAYTIGLEVLTQLNNKFSLTFGAHYSVKGEKTKPSEFTYGDLIGTNGISSSNAVNYNVYFKYNTTYLDLPIRIDYYFSLNKISPFISSGISTNIFLFEKINSYESVSGIDSRRNSSLNTDNYSMINFQYQLAVGIDVAFSKSRLRIFPITRLSLNKVNKIDYGVNSRFYSIGLGISYFFGI